MADTNAIVAKLQELGMTGEGATQLMAGEQIGSADDRRLLADIVGRTLIPDVNLAGGDMLASSSDSGTSKVSNRMIAENFD